MSILYSDTSGDIIMNELEIEPTHAQNVGQVTVIVRKKDCAITLAYAKNGLAGLPISKVGRHKKCNTKLKCYDGLIYCPKCEIIIET